jgi:long-chain acyl-CoA synthetase
VSFGVAKPMAPDRRAFDLSRSPSLGPALADALLANRSLPFLVETDRGRDVARRTFAEFRTDVARLAELMARRGVGPGSRVAVLLPNGPRWLTGATAALWLGAVVVPLDARADADEQARLLAHCRAATLLVDGPTWRKLRERARPHLALALVADLSLAPAATQPLDGVALSWDAALADLPSAPATPRAPVAGERDAPATIVYSSGTGGRPKGCVLTHGNYLSQLAALATLHPLEPGDAYLSVLPTSHAIDFMCGFLVPALCGARVVHLRTLRPEWLVKAMADHGVTHLSAVPALLEALERRISEKLDAAPPLAKAGLRGMTKLSAWLSRDTPNLAASRLLLRPVHEALGGKLSRIFAGGAFVPRATARRLYELGLPVAIGYGLTEACAVVTVNDLQPFRDDTVGLPIAGTEVRIAAPDATGAGEVHVRGPQVFAGYLDDPELTAETLVGGWLRTGDVGAFDAAGHLRLVGRRKHMVVTGGGLNVYPEDVEGRFDGLGADEHAVLAAHACWPSRPGDDEALLLVVRPKGGAAVDLGAVARGNRALQPHQRVAGAVAWPEPFPRTTSLKLRRDELARLVGQRVARSALLPVG